MLSGIMTKRFVYDAVEVVLTGQTAKRELIRKSRKGNIVTYDIKHEIKPANRNDGEWTKWVRMDELYEIEQEEDDV